MIQRYQRLSLRAKVVLSMTMIIFAYSVIFIVTTIKNAGKELYAQMEESSAESVKQFDNHLDTLQSDLINISSLPYTNRFLLDIIEGKEDIGLTKNQSYVYDFLLGTTLFNESINFSGLTGEDILSNGYYTARDNSFGLNSFQELKESPAFIDFESSGKSYGCYNLPKEDTRIISQNLSDKIIFLRTINNLKGDFALMGYMLLGVDLGEFTKFCETFMEDDKSGMLVLDSKGNLIFQQGIKVDKSAFASSKNVFGKPIYKVLEGSKYLICSSGQNQFGWKIYYYRDLKYLPSMWFSNSAVYVILIALASVSVFCIMAILITSAVTSPLKHLLTSMQKFQQGDFEQNVPVKYNDEIGQLTAGYNQMILNIKELIEQNYAIKLEEKEAELGALQAQINPHFLYNTLDLLHWKASAGGQDEIVSIVYSLAKLFRLSLNKGEVWISIGKEKEFLTHYLTLQKALLSDRLDFLIKADTSLEHFKIPRFILQPFVENAVVHGFQDMIESPRITVIFYEEQGYMHIVVEDNGCGMEQSMADEIFMSGEEKPDGIETGYAVGNVKKRLSLYFGKTYTLKVNSKLGSGTRIELTFSGITKEKGD